VYYNKFSGGILGSLEIDYFFFIFFKKKKKMSRAINRGFLRPNKLTVSSLEVVGQTQLGDDVKALKKITIGDGNKRMILDVNDDEGFVIRLEDEENPEDVTLQVQNSEGEPASVGANLGTAAFQNVEFFLQSANNLSDVGDVTEARTNLGLGTAALEDADTFLQVENNLSDLGDAAEARTNLGLGTAALEDTSSFLQTANNLSDLDDVTAARTSLGLGTAATHDHEDYLPAETDSFSTLTVTNLSTTNTFYPPRLTTTQRNALTPTEGAIVYDTTLDEVYMYNGTTWKALYSDVPPTPSAFEMVFFGIPDDETSIASDSNTSIIFDNSTTINTDYITRAGAVFTSVGTNRFVIFCQLTFLASGEVARRVGATISASGVTNFTTVTTIVQGHAGGRLLCGDIRRTNGQTFSIVCRADGGADLLIITSNTTAAEHTASYADLGEGVLSHLTIYKLP